MDTKWTYSYLTALNKLNCSQPVRAFLSKTIDNFIDNVLCGYAMLSIYFENKNKIYLKKRNFCEI